MPLLERRDVLKFAAAAPVLCAPVLCAPAALAVPFPAPAIIPHRCVVRLATPQSGEATSGVADDAYRFCRLIERMTAGHIHFDLEAAADPVGELMAGAVESIFGYEHDKVRLHPAFAYFAGLPGGLGLPAARHLTWLQSRETQQLWQRLSAGFGFTSLFAGHTTLPALLIGEAPEPALPTAPNLRIEAMGLGRDVARGLGYAPPKNGAEPFVREVLRFEDLKAAGRRAGLTFTNSPFATHGSALVLTVADASMSLPDRNVLSAAVRAIARGLAGDSEKRCSCELLLRAAAKRTGQLNECQFIPATLADIRHVCEAVVAEISGRDSLTQAIDCSYTAAFAVTGSVVPVS